MSTNSDLQPAGRSTDPTSGPLPVLHVLRLSGFAAPDLVAARTGLSETSVRAVLGEAATAGLVVERNGRISGWSLTPAGRAEHARLLADELRRTGARPAVETATAAFLVLNEPFKQVCAHWQLTGDGRPNDHTDQDYDRGVIDELKPLHEQVVALTAVLAETLPRFAGYPTAFSDALRRLLDGDRRAFAAPLSASYHDAWMELHQDLLSTLGRDRSAADGH